MRDGDREILKEVSIWYVFDVLRCEQDKLTIDCSLKLVKARGERFPGRDIDTSLFEIRESVDF